MLNIYCMLSVISLISHNLRATISNKNYHSDVMDLETVVQSEISQK